MCGAQYDLPRWFLCRTSVRLLSWLQHRKQAAYIFDDGSLTKTTHLVTALQKVPSLKKCFTFAIPYLRIPCLYTHHLVLALQFPFEYQALKIVYPTPAVLTTVSWHVRAEVTTTC